MRCFLPMLLLFVGWPAMAQGSSEWVVQPTLPSLAVAFERRDRGSTIVERIAPDETLEQWTVMATNQRFAGLLAQGATLGDWLGNFLGGLNRGCPGYRTADRRDHVVSGRPAIDIRVDCPLNPATGLPETFFLRAIAGRSDLHVAQFAYRRRPSQADVERAWQHLNGVGYCERSTPTPACRAAASTPEAR